MQHFFVASHHYFDRPRIVSGGPQGFDRVQECHDAALHVEDAGAVCLAVPDGEGLPGDGAGGDGRIHMTQEEDARRGDRAGQLGDQHIAGLCELHGTDGRADFVQHLPEPAGYEVNTGLFVRSALHVDYFLPQ